MLIGLSGVEPEPFEPESNEWKKFAVNIPYLSFLQVKDTFIQDVLFI